MTASGAQAALMAVAVGLYLYDSLLLLYSNEGVLVARGRERWAVRFGSGLRVRGKEVFLPSPFLPHRPLFRLTWNPEAGVVQPLAPRRDLYRPLAPMIWGMTFALFVLLPLGLFTRLGDPLLLAAIALIYLNIVAALGWLTWKRAAFGLGRKQLATLAFESLVCSPFGLNLVRKVSLAMPVSEELAHAARRLLAPEDWSACRAELQARVKERLLDSEEDSSEAKALQTYSQTVLEEPCPPPKSS